MTDDHGVINMIYLSIVMCAMPKKDVLIRGVDDSIYRRAKATAASKGIALGNAVGEALAGWVKEAEDSDIEALVDVNLNFVRASWGKIRPFKGKAVVVSDGKLQGVFPTYEEARRVASRKKIAVVFVVDEKPSERELDFGPELEV